MNITTCPSRSLGLFLLYFAIVPEGQANIDLKTSSRYDGVVRQWVVILVGGDPLGDPGEDAQVWLDFRPIIRVILVLISSEKIDVLGERSK